MKILLISGEYPPMQGGVGDYTHELSRAFIDLGAEAEVLTSLEGHGKEAESAPFAREITVHPLVTRWDWKSTSLILDQVRQIQPDVVHIQYQTAAFAMHPAINFLPWWGRKRLGKAGPLFLVTYHDVKVPYLFPKAGPARRWVTRFIARHSDAAVVTNEEDRQLLAHYRWRREPVLIPIGSNIHSILAEGFDRDRQRARWGFTPDDAVLCYFGFLNDSKGGETLIRVLDTLVKSGYHARLLMIGGKLGSSDPTNIAYAQHVDALIDSLDLSDHIRWTGFTSNEEVTANLMAADICLLPYTDGASFRRGSFMAALAHGRPIVSTIPKVAIPELVDGENIALAPADDVSALTARVEELIANPQQRERLGKGAKVLSRMFEWDHIARQTMEVYRDLGAS
jgi:glycosyltransferase involved in cell wall biosynthesis